MRRLTHPLTGATYEWAEDGIGPVRVRDRSGRHGRFDRDGRRVAGVLLSVDPELCRWVVSGGPESGGAAGRSRRFATADIVTTSGADATTNPSEPAIDRRS